MKNIVLLILFSTPLFFLSQKNRNISVENNEVFLNEDKKWVSSLDQYDSPQQAYNSHLQLKTFQERFVYLNTNTKLNIDYNDVTYTYVQRYLSYRWYHKIIGLSAYYFPLFEAVLQKYGVPKELKYLAVVESALNPRAGSWAGASGLWQFMPATGAQYGLFKSEYYNGFHDPVANTDAAARYLRDLYKIFGDWNLAISAYNCGPGNVNKAIRKAGTKQYWKVRPYLPKETQAYVPSFIAVNYMFNYYVLHGIKPMYFKYNFYDIKRISNTKPTMMNHIQGDSEFLRFANPQFPTDYIPANSIIYTK